MTNEIAVVKDEKDDVGLHIYVHVNKKKMKN
jgi:hypothetical protein